MPCVYSFLRIRENCGIKEWGSLCAITEKGNTLSHSQRGEFSHRLHQRVLGNSTCRGKISDFSTICFMSTQYVHRHVNNCRASNEQFEGKEMYWSWDFAFLKSKWILHWSWISLPVHWIDLGCLPKAARRTTWSSSVSWALTPSRCLVVRITMSAQIARQCQSSFLHSAASTSCGCVSVCG